MLIKSKALELKEEEEEVRIGFGAIGRSREWGMAEHGALGSLERRKCWRFGLCPFFSTLVPLSRIPFLHFFIGLSLAQNFKTWCIQFPNQLYINVFQFLRIQKYESLSSLCSPLFFYLEVTLLTHCMYVLRLFLYIYMNSYIFSLAYMHM